MNKFFLILRNEIRTVVLRPSFFITLLALPLLGFIIVSVAGYLQRNESDFSLEELFAPQFEASLALEGFVDASGLLEALPPGMEHNLRRYLTEDAAQAALQSGEIGAYYLVAPDYLTSGAVEYVQLDYDLMSSIGQRGQITSALNYNLLKDQPDLWARLSGAVTIQEERLAALPESDLPAEGAPLTETAPEQAENPFVAYAVPYAVMMIFYIVILTASSLLLNSISIEKQNRVIEILMTSVTPHTLLAGKITALGLVGLLQTVVWLGTGQALARLSGRALDLPEVSALPPTLLLWGVVFFLLGYAVYASLMAAVGALVPNVREASQLTTLLVMPMIIPLVMISVLIAQPNGMLTTVLSLFPLTAPSTMMLRLASGEVPLWQILLSAALLALTAAFIVRAAARLFHAQNLLSGQAISIPRYFRALLGRG